MKREYSFQRVLTIYFKSLANARNNIFLFNITIKAKDYPYYTMYIVYGSIGFGNFLKRDPKPISSIHIVSVCGRLKNNMVRSPINVFFSAKYRFARHDFFTECVAL